MPGASLTLLTPLGALLALAVVLPLAAFALAERRVERARALLRLPPPHDARRATTILALAAVPVLLGLAAAQPALRTFEGMRTRTDTEALFVLDVSRSMAAAAAPGAPTRLARARAAAVRLRAAIPEVPSGVATMTDRVLPSLLPTPDAATFNSTIERTVRPEQPPPLAAEVVATTLQALSATTNQGFFTPRKPRRLVVVLTDGESRPFNPSSVARALGRPPGASLTLVHVWNEDERIYSPEGRPEEAYRPDEASASVLEALAAASGGHVFGESDADGAAAALRAAAGAGPTTSRGRAPKTTTLAPYVAGAALLPLLFLLVRPSLTGRRAKIRSLPSFRSSPA
jgi:von Willebrand factor type A domain